MIAMSRRRHISAQVSGIRSAVSGWRSWCRAARTASRAWASMASTVQRRQDVQRRTWCSSRPVSVLLAWVGWAAQRGGPMCGAPFPRDLPPNRTCEFPRIRLSDDLCREYRGGLTCVDVFMTSGAADKGFASASGHERGPRGLGWVPWAEFGEITDVMDFHPLAGEVHTPLRPRAGVVGVARELLQAVQLRDARHRKTAGGHDHVTGGDPVAVPVLTVHCPVASSKAAPATRVSNWMSRRRSNRSATWLR